MARYLIKNTVEYRVPTVEDALAFRDELQKTPYAELSSFSYTQKETKEDEWVNVKAKLEFNMEKAPDTVIEVTYSGEGEY